MLISFMPLITDNSSKRPWVHQETGYAMALNIPVLPVAINSVPGEIVSQLQAIVVKNDFSDFAENILQVDLEQLVQTPSRNLFSSIEISDWAERRTELLAKNDQLVMDLGAFGKVRQRASLSSPGNPIWKARYGDVHHSPYNPSSRREERKMLERHACQMGCDLIIDPDFCLVRNGILTTRTRLQILMDFLISMPDEKIRIVLSSQAG